jgi:hypothetical protein
MDDRVRHGTTRLATLLVSFSCAASDFFPDKPQCSKQIRKKYEVDLYYAPAFAANPSASSRSDTLLRFEAPKRVAVEGAFLAARRLMVRTHKQTHIKV